jgi:hypothetical protein
MCVRAHRVERRSLNLYEQLARAGLVDRLGPNFELALRCLEPESLLLLSHGVRGVLRRIQEEISKKMAQPAGAVLSPFVVVLGSWWVRG